MTSFSYTLAKVLDALEMNPREFDSILGVRDGTTILWIEGTNSPPKAFEKVVLDIITEKLDNEATKIKQLQEKVKQLRYRK